MRLIKGERDLDADTSDFRAQVLSTSCCLKEKKEEMGKAVTWTLSRFSKDGKGGISISTLKFCTCRHSLVTDLEFSHSTPVTPEWPTSGNLPVTSTAQTSTVLVFEVSSRQVFFNY